jgi:hypothetical protein
MSDAMSLITNRAEFDTLFRKYYLYLGQPEAATVLKSGADWLLEDQNRVVRKLKELGAKFGIKPD